MVGIEQFEINTGKINDLFQVYNTDGSINYSGEKKEPSSQDAVSILDKGPEPEVIKKKIDQLRLPLERVDPNK